MNGEAGTRATIDQLRQAHPILRFMACGFVAFGCVGIVVGTIIGLYAHATTAWAAAIEIGLPSAVLGAVIGALAGSVVACASRGR